MLNTNDILFKGCQGQLERACVLAYCYVWFSQLLKIIIVHIFFFLSSKSVRKVRISSIIYCSCISYTD